MPPGRVCSKKRTCPVPTDTGPTWCTRESRIKGSVLESPIVPVMCSAATTRLQAPPTHHAPMCETASTSALHRKLAAVLDAGVASGECAGFVLVASNPFLGQLKAHLGERSRKAILRTVPSDYTRLRDDELAQRLHHDT